MGPTSWWRGTRGASFAAPARSRRRGRPQGLASGPRCRCATSAWGAVAGRGRGPTRCDASTITRSRMGRRRRGRRWEWRRRARRMTTTTTTTTVRRRRRTTGRIRSCRCRSRGRRHRRPRAVRAAARSPRRGASAVTARRGSGGITITGNLRGVRAVARHRRIRAISRRRRRLVRGGAGLREMIICWVVGSRSGGVISPNRGILAPLRSDSGNLYFFFPSLSLSLSSFLICSGVGGGLGDEACNLGYVIVDPSRESLRFFLGV